MCEHFNFNNRGDVNLRETFDDEEGNVSIGGNSTGYTLDVILRQVDAASHELAEISRYNPEREILSSHACWGQRQDGSSFGHVPTSRSCPAEEAAEDEELRELGQ